MSPNCVRSFRLALASILLVVASSPMSDGFTFEVVSKDSPSAPVVMTSAPGASSVDCAVQCAQTDGCHGFSWLRGLCELFNLGAFSDTWKSSDGCEVFKLGTTVRKLEISNCSQSSTVSTQTCWRAIDGFKDVNNNSIFAATEGRFNEWWEANLAVPSLVSYLYIYNRSAAREWLTSFLLLVDGVECNRVNLTIPFAMATFNCSAFGSAVRVQTLRSDPLVLMEVEIFGY